MHYIIVNINKMVVYKSYIYVSGRVDKDEDSNSDGFLYTDSIIKAKSFDSEQNAWFYIYDAYGMHYGRRTFVVLSAKQEAIDNLSRIKTGEKNG